MKNDAAKLDLGPYYSDSQIKGARYLLITPGTAPFMARIVAEVPDLETARKIIELWNGAPNDAEIAGAVARGWCSPNNAHKVMDSELAFAITAQVIALLTPTESTAKP